jgi:hypothetical protein
MVILSNEQFKAVHGAASNHVKPLAIGKVLHLTMLDRLVIRYGATSQIR